jgi:hypothetical protein
VKVGRRIASPFAEQQQKTLIPGLELVHQVHIVHSSVYAVYGKQALPTFMEHHQKIIFITLLPGSHCRW